MKVIIAGGRDYKSTEQDTLRLNELLNSIPITEVVCGLANGADAYGASWAEFQGLPVAEFPANWDAYGKAAGMLRNKEMADYADAVILFPGGRGTDNMFSLAVEGDLIVHDYRKGLGLF